jgi:hypothetical protein
MVEIRHIRRLNSRHAGRKPAICAQRSNPLLLWIALLALAIQIFVIQTHIHGTTFAAARDSVSASGTMPAALPNHPDRFPVGDDPSNCPLCQEFAHFSQFTHSVSIHSAPLLSSTVILPVLYESRSVFAAATHSWYGRAPPTPSESIRFEH